eukprot:jgi/Psemu1/19325/gm1.19325_g
MSTISPKPTRSPWPNAAPIVPHLQQCTRSDASASTLKAESTPTGCGTTTPSDIPSPSNQYSTILDDTDTEDLFVESTTTDAKVLAPSMMTNLRGSVVNAITYPLPQLTELQKGHITQLLSGCAVYYIAPNGDSKKLRGPADLEKAAKDALAHHTDDSSKPSITIELLITSWKFKSTWKAQHFDKVYAIPIPVPSSCAGIPPVKPIESVAKQPIQVPAQANNSIIDTPAPSNLIPVTYTSSSIVIAIVPSPGKAIPSDTTKMVDSNAAEALSGMLFVLYVGMSKRVIDHVQSVIRQRTHDSAIHMSMQTNSEINKSNSNSNSSSNSSSSSNSNSNSIGIGVHPCSGDGTNNRMSLWTYPWLSYTSKHGSNGRRIIDMQQKRSISNSNFSANPTSTTAAATTTSLGTLNLFRVARSLPAMIVCCFVVSQILVQSSYDFGQSLSLREAASSSFPFGADTDADTDADADNQDNEDGDGDLSLAVLVAGSTQRFLFDSFVKHVARASSNSFSEQRRQRRQQRQSVVHIDFFAILSRQSGPAFRQSEGYMRHLAGRDRMFDGIEGLTTTTTAAAAATTTTAEGDNEDRHSITAVRDEMLAVMTAATLEASASSGWINTHVRGLRLMEAPIEDDPILHSVWEREEQKYLQAQKQKQQKQKQKKQPTTTIDAKPFDLFQQFPMMDLREKAITRTRAGNKNMIRLFLALESLWKTEFLDYEQQRRSRGAFYDYVLILRDDALWLGDFDLHAIIATDPAADAYVLSCDARNPKMLSPEICDHAILIKRDKADVVGAYVTAMASMDLNECHVSVTEYVGKLRGCNSEMILRHVLKVHGIAVKEVPQSLLPFERAVRIEAGGGDETTTDGNGNYYCYHKYCQSVDQPLKLPPSIQKCKELTF